MRLVCFATGLAAPWQCCSDAAGSGCPACPLRAAPALRHGSYCGAAADRPVGDLNAELPLDELDRACAAHAACEAPAEACDAKLADEAVDLWVGAKRARLAGGRIDGDLVEKQFLIAAAFGKRKRLAERIWTRLDEVTARTALRRFARLGTDVETPSAFESIFYSIRDFQLSVSSKVWGAARAVGSLPVIRNIVEFLFVQLPANWEYVWRRIAKRRRESAAEKEDAGTGHQRRRASKRGASRKGKGEL